MRGLDNGNIICSYRSVPDISPYSLCRIRRDNNTLFAPVSADYLHSRAAVHGPYMVSFLADPQNFLFCCNVVAPFPTSSASRICNGTVGSFFHYSILLAHSYNCRYSRAFGHHLYIAANFNIYGSDFKPSIHPTVIFYFSNFFTKRTTGGLLDYYCIVFK